MSEPKVIAAARAMLRGYYNCEPLPMLAEQLADALLAETQRCLREATAENEQLRAALADPTRDNSSRDDSKGPTCKDSLPVAQPAAPAEPEAKPEPFVWYDDDTGETWTTGAVQDGGAPDGLRPLYAAPIKQDVPATSFGNMEPVAYLYTYHGKVAWGDRLEFPGTRWQGPGYNHMPNNWRETPLYTAPPRREWVPLTEPEMHTLDWPNSWQYDEVRAFCESVEAKLREMNS